MLGPRGMAFDNDDVLDLTDDEDLRDDPISKMDMQVCLCSLSFTLQILMQKPYGMKSHLQTFFRECAARNTNHFTAVADQLTVEESVVLRQLVGAN